MYNISPIFEHNPTPLMFLSLTLPLSFSSCSGDKLCSVEDCIPGTGVYLRHGYIYSSLAGYVLRKNEGEEVRSLVGEKWGKLQKHSDMKECRSVPLMRHAPYFV